VDNTASIVNESGQQVVATVTNLAGPTGVAVDPLLGEAVVAQTNSNQVAVFAVSSSPGTPNTIAVGQGPAAVAVNPATHVAAVADGTGNTVSLVNISSLTNLGTPGGYILPSAVVFDPISSNFFVSSALANSLTILNPTSQTNVGTLRVGIN